MYAIRSYYGVANNTDKVILNKCRVIGRQDSVYGGTGARVVVYKGAMMGAVDYIFGGMDAVFYQTDFVLNTSDAGSDAAYIAAAQQTSGRGFLMYECHVITSYSIHYTKLYENTPNGVTCHDTVSIFVITSYSIHYTKLYEYKKMGKK